MSRRRERGRGEFSITTLLRAITFNSHLVVFSETFALQSERERGRVRGGGGERKKKIVLGRYKVVH